MKLRNAAILLVTGLWTLACDVAPRPATLSVDRENCAYCKMIVSQSDFASQVVERGELPKFFDDLACLKRYLEGTPERPEGAAVFVADHETREWVPIESAVFSRVPRLPTPMSSHYVAHATTASRDGDSRTVGGLDVPLGEIVPAAWLTPAGKQ